MIRTLLRFVSQCFVLFLTLCSPQAVSGWEAASVEKFVEQGLKAFDRGAFEESVPSWIEAARRYELQRRPAGQVAALNRLAQAYSALGQYNQAIKSLETALEQAQKLSDPARVASVLAALGHAHTAVGALQAAEAELKQSLGMASALRERALAAVILNNLGNLYAIEKKYTEAIAAYRESVLLAERAAQWSLRARALINAGVALRQNGEARESELLLDTAFDQRPQLRASHDTAFLLISLSLAYRDLRAWLPGSSNRVLLRAAEALNESATVAERLGDRRTASYVWGYLGALYEDEDR